MSATRRTYWQKLQDPRWQKKRLEVLEREKWKCEECCEKGETLHVHHCYYEKGVEPWDYPLDSLKCLCAECHKQRQEEELFVCKFLSTLNIQDINSLQCDVFEPIAFLGLEEVCTIVRFLRWDDGKRREVLLAYLNRHSNKKERV